MSGAKAGELGTNAGRESELKGSVEISPHIPLSLGTTSDLPAQPIANNTIADGDIEVMGYSENRNRMTC